MFCRNFITAAGHDLRIIPVSVIDLKLNEFRIRMLSQKLIKKFRSIVERKAPVADKSFAFELLYVIPDPVLIIERLVALVQRVEQVKIEIAGFGALQADPEFIPCLLTVPGCEGRGVQLCRQIIGVAGIALNKCLPGRLLGSFVYKCGIYVPASCRKESIHHFRSLFYIDCLLAVPDNLREAHHAET